MKQPKPEDAAFKLQSLALSPVLQKDKKHISILTDGAGVIRFQQTYMLELNDRIRKNHETIEGKTAEIEALNEKLLDMKQLHKEMLSMVEILQYNMNEALNALAAKLKSA